MRGTHTSASDVSVADLTFGRSGGQQWLRVRFADGRVFALPLTIFPTLLDAAPARRKNWRLIGKGDGVHWPDLDLDLSADGLLAGRPEMTRSTRSRLPLDVALKHLVIDAHSPISVAEIARALRTKLSPAKLRTLVQQLKHSAPTLASA